MTLIATDGKRLSAVIAHEYEPAVGYCRDVVTVTVVEGMGIGAVLDNTGVLVAAAAEANATYVLIDERVKDLAPGTHDLLVLSRGPVILKDYQLEYGTGADADAVAAALKAKGMIVELTV